MRGDPFNIDDLRIDPTDPHLVGKAAGSRRPNKWQRKFVRMPWSWLDRMKAVNRGSTYRVASLLVYAHWRNGGRPIRLANAALVGEGVTRMSKGRALRELERLGLVKVEWRDRKSPVVTLKFIPKT